jgi:thioester reductase-like protein
MTGAVEAEDLLAQITLDPVIRPAPGRAAASDRERGVLLTGATGFVGAHVLANLARRGLDRIVCLVRASDEERARERIRVALEKYGLDSSMASKACTSLPGDLGAERLGLSPAKFDELAADVGTIIHCGAWVHLSHPYHVLRPVNVGGVCEMLRLAVSGPLKRVCHLSGTSVFRDCPEMTENAPPPFVPVSHGGYLDTKWVSERIVWEAFERGVPGAVVRLGWISGDSRRGLIAESDAMTLVIQACFRLGVAPRFDDDSIRCTPVDLAAEGIVRIALDEGEGTRAYNLSSTHEITFQSLYDAGRAAGVDVVLESRQRWLERIARRLPLLLPIAHSVLKEWKFPPLRNELALSVLRDSERAISNEALLRTYLPVWRRQRPSVLRAANG